MTAVDVEDAVHSLGEFSRTSQQGVNSTAASVASLSAPRPASSEVLDSSDEARPSLPEPTQANVTEDSLSSVRHPVADPDIALFLENVPVIKEEFVVLRKIGGGTFSSVYLAYVKAKPNELLALKHIIPTSSPFRIENELLFLDQLKGEHNVVGVLSCVRYCDHVVLIMPYIQHQRFQDYLLHMTVADTSRYLASLFTALKHVHSHRIIHRDVKPSNFLHCPQSKSYHLVDFGLAHEEGQDPLKSLRATRCRLILNTGKSEGGLQQKMKKAPPCQVRESRLKAKKDFSKHGASSMSTHSGNSMFKHSGSSMSRKRQADPLFGIEPHAKRHSLSDAFGVSSQIRPLANGKKLVRTYRPTAEAPSGNWKRSSSVEELASRPSKGKSFCPIAHSVREVCSTCLSRPSQSAARAGTPGFRAPEVLLKCPKQTTAVDIWSAGVTLLCILSGRFPFFKAQDDMTALAQIITVFGFQRLEESVQLLNKEVVCSSVMPPCNLKDLCEKLRSGCTCTQRTGDIDLRRSPRKHCGQSPVKKKSGQASVCSWCKKRRRSSSGGETAVIQDSSWLSVPDEAYDLLAACLDLNPGTRISAQDALSHPFIVMYSNKS